MSDLAAIVDAIAESLRSALLRYAGVLPPSLITIGKLALSAPGKTLAIVEQNSQGAPSAQQIPRWPVHVILSYQIASPPERRDSWHEALPAAVAVEIAMAAADLLDEVADQDPSPIVAQYGAGQAMNTADLMLVMAQQILSRYAREGGSERALAALGALQDMLVEAAAGQHLDMLYERMGPGEVTLEMAADVTAKKAGALIGGTYRVGAAMAGGGEQTSGLLEQFGREVGGIAQIVNDLEDVLPRDPDDASGPDRKTDLRLRKRTLPIVFTLRDDAPGLNALQRAFTAGPGWGVNEEEQRDAIMKAGGVQFAQLIMEVHRQRAREIVAELEALSPGSRELLAPVFHDLVL